MSEFNAIIAVFLLLARDLGQAAYWESRVSIGTVAITVKTDSVAMAESRAFTAFYGIR